MNSPPSTSTVPSGRTSQEILFMLLVIFYVLYAGTFILSTSIEVSGQRYFVLFDDAMISMRYAGNLAHGYGLVWNPGEAPVEGYTNTLWTLFMTLFHLFPLAKSWICLPVQITGILTQISTIVLVRKISQNCLGKQAMISWLPVLLTAFYLPLNNWALQGMEVGILALLLAFCALKMQEILDKGCSALPVFLALGLANLLRMDSLIPCLITIACLCLFDPAQRKKYIKQGSLCILLSLGLLQLFRLFYFHDLLPNTYYLKLSGYPLFPRLAQGASNLGSFLLKSNPWLFVIAAFALIKEQEKKFLTYLGAVLLGQFTYSVYVGGDAWEGWGNRYITEAMPLFFVLFACGIRSLAELKMPGKRGGWLPRLVACLVAVLSFFSVNNVPGLKNLFLLERPISYDFNKVRLSLALALDQVLLPPARIATTLSGILPYFCGRRDVDMLGKCDPVVARQEMHRLENIVPEEASWRWFYPGHMKWDYEHSIGKLAPDVVVELWALPQEAEPFLKDRYKRMSVAGYPVYLRKDSANIKWDSKLIEEIRPQADSSKDRKQAS